MAIISYIKIIANVSMVSECLISRFLHFQAELASVRHNKGKTDGKNGKVLATISYIKIIANVSTAN